MDTHVTEKDTANTLMLMMSSAAQDPIPRIRDWRIAETEDTTPLS